MTCFKFFQMLIFVMFFLGLYHGLYKRSLSFFAVIFTLFVFAVSYNYVSVNVGWAIMCIGIVGIYITVMFRTRDKNIAM